MFRELKSQSMVRRCNRSFSAPFPPPSGDPELWPLQRNMPFSNIKSTPSRVVVHSAFCVMFVFLGRIRIAGEGIVIAGGVGSHYMAHLINVISCNVNLNSSDEIELGLRGRRGISAVHGEKSASKIVNKCS